MEDGNVGILRRRRRPEHDPGVVYVYDANEDLAYYGAVCRCGWFTEPVDSPGYPNAELEGRMTAAALAHHPAADTNVAFPLDEPPR